MSPELFDKLLFLTRLSVSPAERELLLSTIDHTLQMIDAMQKAPTDQVPPLQHPLDATLLLREDKVTEQVDRDNLQSVAPAVSDGLYLVPQVIE